MKLAELFVAIGFKVEGGEVLPQIDRQLDSAANKVGKLALGIDVITAGLGFMADLATNTAVGLHKFALSTGLSTQELQQWQHTAVLSNVSAKEMTETITSLQAVHAKMMLQGGATAAPWLLLGIAPSEKDPFKMMEALNKAFSGLDKSKLAAARTISGMAGFGENIFQMLRRSDLPIDTLKQMYILTDRDQAKLVELNKEWLTFTDQSQRLSNVFMAEMAPALTRVLELLIRVVDKMAQFVHFMQGGAGDSWRHYFQEIVLGIGTVGFALTGLAGILKGLSLLTGAFDVLLSPWVVIAAGIAGEALAVGALTSAVQHFHDVNAPKTGRDVIPGYDPSSPDGRPRDRTPWRGRGLGDVLGHPGHSIFGETLRDLFGRSGTTLRIERIQIDGSKDPQATGRAVVDSLTRMLTYAGSQAPAANV